MPGLTFSNEPVSKDEDLHAEFACLVQHAANKLPGAIVHDIARKAVTAERRYICEVTPCDRTGTNNEGMTKYIELLLTGCSLP